MSRETDCGSGKEIYWILLKRLGDRRLDLDCGKFGVHVHQNFIDLLSSRLKHEGVSCPLTFWCKWNVATPIVGGPEKAGRSTGVRPATCGRCRRWELGCPVAKLVTELQSGSCRGWKALTKTSHDLSRHEEGATSKIAPLLPDGGVRAGDSQSNAEWRGNQTFVPVPESSLNPAQCLHKPTPKDEQLLLVGIKALKLWHGPM